MKVQATIDYLQFTSLEAPEFLDGAGLLGYSPLPFYRHCRTYECGTRIYTGNVQSEKMLVQMAGKACDNHNMTDYPQRLKYALMRGSKFSRIDLAITVEGLESLYKFREAVQANTIQAKRFEKDEPKIVTGADGMPQTVYLGDLKKRSRKGCFRAYDKGKELGIEAMISRFELEIRQKRANTAVRRVIGGHGIGNIIRNVVDIPQARWWIDMMGAKSEKLPRFAPDEQAEPIVTRWKWLHTQVAPALGKLLAVDPHATANLDKFNKLIEAELRRTELLDVADHL